MITPPAALSPIAFMQWIQDFDDRYGSSGRSAFTNLDVSVHHIQAALTELTLFHSGKQAGWKGSADIVGDVLEKAESSIAPIAFHPWVHARKRILHDERLRQNFRGTEDPL